MTDNTNIYFTFLYKRANHARSRETGKLIDRKYNHAIASNEGKTYQTVIEQCIIQTIATSLDKEKNKT